MERRREELGQVTEQMQSTWILPYGNLMTILMVFFLILYAWNHYLMKIYAATIIDSETIRMQKELKKYAKVQFSRDETRLQLAESIMFDSGSAELKPGAKKVLRNIISVLKESNEPIVVEGHTDNYPIISSKYRSNWHLSCARAFSVVRYITEYEDIPPERISGWGYAAYRPIAPFDTMKNRAKNRRIEIVVLHEEIPG